MRNWLRTLSTWIVAKAFRLGQAVVERLDTSWGHDQTTFTPENYGEFLATSVAVYAASKLRASNLAKIPLRFYKIGRDGKRTEVTSGKLVELLARVNPFWTFRRLLRMTELSLCAWGSCFYVLERGKNGRQTPSEMWWAKPDRMRVITDPENYVAGFVYDWNGQQLFFQTGEVIWLRYDNPIDEFSGLSPIAAARLSIEMGQGALRSNKAIFDQGLQLAGIVAPESGAERMGPNQVVELQELLRRRFQGVDKAHKVAVLSQAVKFQSVSVSPKDAQFIDMMKWSLEDVCRVMSVPLDLLGGQRTYENVDAAQEALWRHCLIPEGDFIADELTEQLLPMFPGEADVAEFDYSQVEALVEDRTEIVDQMMKLWTMGVPLNRLLQEYQPNLLPEGEEGYAWGDIWWARVNGPLGSDLVPISGPTIATPPAPVGPAPLPAETPMEQTERALVLLRAYANEQSPSCLEAGAAEDTGPAFGSAEHERIWKTSVDRIDRQEQRLVLVLRDLFKRQQDAVLGRFHDGKTYAIRAATPVEDDPFDRAAWGKRFKERVQPLASEILEEVATAALAELEVSISFDVFDERVLRYVESSMQSVAREVILTTWDSLRQTLEEGIAAGESIPELTERVRKVFTIATENRAEMIARTVANGAANAGTLEAYRQSGVVKAKRWLCVDGDTRVSGVGVICAARRWYVGRMVELSTASRRVVTVTAQHQILTRRGWVAAEHIQEGDDLVCDQIGIEGTTPGTGGMPNIQHMPPRIAEVFDASFEPASRVGMVSRVVNLDGEGRETQIDVVPVDCDLARRLEPACAERFCQHGFILTDQFLATLVADGAPGSRSVCHSPVGIRGPAGGDASRHDCRALPGCPQHTSFRHGAGRLAALAENAADGRLGTSPSDGKSPCRESLLVVGDDLLRMGVEVVAANGARGHERGGDPPPSLFGCLLSSHHTLRSGGTADWLPEPTQAEHDRAGRTPILGAELLRGDALPVALGYDRCVRVKRSFAECHVYDYSTQTGWMIANGLVVHNSAMDERVRDTHRIAHGQVRLLSENFTVGGASGPAPGQISDASENIRCRCVMIAVLKEVKVVPSSNGHIPSEVVA